MKANRIMDCIQKQAFLTINDAIYDGEYEDGKIEGKIFMTQVKKGIL